MARFAVNNPLIAIQLTFALCLMVYGAYIGGPWYVSTAPIDTTAYLYETTWLRWALASLYFIPGAAGAISVLTRRVDMLETSALLMFFCLLFLTIIRIVTFGWLPLVWLIYLMTALASSIIYLSYSGCK